MDCLVSRLARAFPFLRQFSGTVIGIAGKVRKGIRNWRDRADQRFARLG
jgi:hypothetical protein